MSSAGPDVRPAVTPEGTASGVHQPSLEVHEDTERNPAPTENNSEMLYQTPGEKTDIKISEP